DSALSYVESAAAASSPVGGVPCGSDGAQWSDRRAPRGLLSGTPCPGAPGRPRRGSDRYRYLSRMPGRLSDSRFSLAPSRAQLSSEAVAPRPDGCPSCPRLWLRNGGIRLAPPPAPPVKRRLPSSSTQSRVAANRCRGTRHRSGTPSFVRHG